MAKLTPKIDNFTEGVNKTIPSVTEGLTPKIRKSVISDSIGAVKGEICNKIDGAINLISGIKTGANNILNEVLDFDINSFFEGPFTGVTDKINNVVNAFKSSFDSFKNQEANLEIGLNSQIQNLNNELTQRFESSKIANKGFDNSLNSIQNFSNNTIRDINSSLATKNNLSSLLCDQSKDDMIDNAIKETSNELLASNQENLIEKSNKLINVKPESQISSFVNKQSLPEFVNEVSV
tara:strand:+ start:725 stop:1432 length:708 start_codon:yes stop_codon:yes gene_type:complete